MSKKSDNKIIPIITGVIGFFGGITFVNNWLVLNKEFPKSEYLEVPFNPDAWGNIADWAIVLITGFTAYYLVKTFREQQTITKLEQKRFLDSYLPILEVCDVKYENSNSISKTTFKVTVNSNPLQNLEIRHNFPNYINVSLPYIIKNVMFAKGKTMEFEVTIVHGPAIIEITEYTGHTITFMFEDSLGNKYHQYLFFHGSTNVHIQPAFRV